jgi:glucose-6-phosphate dehydrogenase assembly protein OpcA
MNEGFSGEPMSVGASGKARAAELEMHFTDAVDLSKIRALLNLARERAGAPVERVLTLNLIGIHYSDASWERARPGLEAASALHPARIVGLIALPNEAETGVTAKVTVMRPKGAAFFIERIVMRATGKAVRRLDSSIDGLLVPDVPTVAVWGGRLEGNLLKRAITSADRLIVDSGSRPLVALGELDAVVKRGAPVGDLAWARIYPWQSLAADVLDIPNLREHRGNIQSVQVITAGAPGPEAMLLAGWFQSRVRRAQVTLVVGATPSEVAIDQAVQAAESHQVIVENSATGTATATLPPIPDPITPGQIIGVRFEAPPAEFQLRREKNGILEAQVRGDDDGELAHRLRLPAGTPGALLVQELKLLSGCDEIYAAALDQATQFAARQMKENP